MTCLVERLDMSVVANKLLMIWSNPEESLHEETLKRVLELEDLTVDKNNKDRFNFRSEANFYQEIKIYAYKQKLTITQLVTRLLIIWANPEDPLYEDLHKEIRPNG